jgi:2-C-methyl-D-erythritol 2,4-cyclodiphosphate synthase
MSFRAGIGFDVHRFKSGRPLVLGGVRIPHGRGLDGHSDADVLCHAVMDAMLGAVGDGDIGRHFPDRDPAWKNARSLDLVKVVRARLAKAGAQVVNVDTTLLAEAPRVAPHAEAMRRNLASALRLSPADVSIKATTMEGMGAIGRSEGIAAMAVAMVRVGVPPRRASIARGGSTRASGLRRRRGGTTH